jgi:hypothetical protein
VQPSGVNLDVNSDAIHFPPSRSLLVGVNFDLNPERLGVETPSRFERSKTTLPIMRLATKFQTANRENKLFAKVGLQRICKEMENILGNLWKKSC